MVPTVHFLVLHQLVHCNARQGEAQVKEVLWNNPLSFLVCVQLISNEVPLSITNFSSSCSISGDECRMPLYHIGLRVTTKFTTQECVVSSCLYIH